MEKSDPNDAFKQMLPTMQQRAEFEKLLPKRDAGAEQLLKAIAADVSSFDVEPVRTAVRQSYEMPKLSRPSSPEEIVEQIVLWIKDFDLRLGNTNQTGAKLVTFGQSLEFYVDDLVCCASPILLIKGHKKDDGEKVELIQHISQISFLLIPLPREKPEEPKKPIGYHTERAET
jgi:hypothetical protein